MGNSNGIKALIIPLAGIRENAGGNWYRCEGRCFFPRACYCRSRGRFLWSSPTV